MTRDSWFRNLAKATSIFVTILMQRPLYHEIQLVLSLMFSVSYPGSIPKLPKNCIQYIDFVNMESLDKWIGEKRYNA